MSPRRWAFGRTRATSSSPRKGALVDFRPAMVDSRLFPLDVFRRLSARQLRGLERKPASYKSPQGNQGNYHLRKAIIKHIAITRAVACQAEDILVTSGAQQAFDLLARALVTPHETTVALEDPGYPPMRVAFAAAGAKLVPVGIDEEGLIIEQLPSDVGCDLRYPVASISSGRDDVPAQTAGPDRICARTRSDHH